MFGQMGLAQSTHLKYMLYNGWAIVVANIILFAVVPCGGTPAAISIGPKIL
jgi:hypothetical protein